LKRKILLGYTFSNILVFLIPIIFSFFISTPSTVGKIYLTKKDKQTVPASIIISVMDHKTNTVTNKDLEEYLVGVVSAEMPASYEPDALKAQAVAARSYIISKKDTKNPAHPDAIVCNNSSHCKAHLSLDEAKEKWGAEWEKDFYPKVKKAVEDTRGEYLAYKDKAVEAFFFALSNGETESSKDVWGSDLPYLKSTKSEGDSTSPNFYSSAEFSVSDFNEKLKKLSEDFKPSENVSIGKTTYTEGGRVKNININGADFSGTDIRSAFSLASADFTITQSDDKIVFNVEGKGHGVGMSQYGANFLAKKGYSYEEILKHYYSGVEIMNKL